MILTIILVQMISYISPVRPEKKKHTRMNNNSLLLAWVGNLDSDIIF